MERQLPTYQLKINPEEDAVVDFVALVEDPAIEKNFLAFGKPLQFASNDERQELLGPAMIPDMLIYRKDKNGEYNVYFDRDTIRQIAQTYFKRGFQSNLNLDHTATPADSYIYQSYIVDSEKGMASPNGLDLVDGSWVIGVKVESPEVWADIKSGKRKGFSVEGIFQMFQEQFSNAVSKEQQEVIDLLKRINDLIIQKTKS